MPPLVSVWMITYNQESYLGQAVESVLSQKTDFPFEIVIGEDCSTDGTREVCLGFQEKYPDKVRLVLHGENRGLVRNFWETLQHCRGKYVAQLEGDDYWTDPKKLQKQVELLERAPRYAFCYHLFDHVDQDGNIIGAAREPLPDAELPKDCNTRMVIDAKWSPLQTLTLMFRRDAFPEMPNWIYKLPIFDWPLHFYLTRAGKGIFLNENMAGYRSHNEGVWSGTDHIKNSLRYYHFYRLVLSAHKGEYEHFMLPRMRFHTREMLEECLPAGKPWTTLHRLGLYLRHHFPAHIDWGFVGMVLKHFVVSTVSSIRVYLGSLRRTRPKNTMNNQ